MFGILVGTASNHMVHLVKSCKYMIILINGHLSNWVNGGCAAMRAGAAVCAGAAACAVVALCAADHTAAWCAARHAAAVVYAACCAAV